MKLLPQTINSIKAAIKAGKLLFKYRNESLLIKIKGDSCRDVVTEVDYASEQIILKEIEREFPNFAYISEEKGDKRNGAKNFWIIDPLDGTANYTSGLPIYGVSIAYVENYSLISGVIYIPETNDLYFAELNKGAYLNNKKLIYTKQNKISNSLISITFPSNFKDKLEEEKSYSTFHELNKISKGALRLGSSVYALALLSVEKLNAIVGFKAKIWDIAAGVLITRESGLETSFKDKNLLEIEHDYIICNKDSFNSLNKYLLLRN